MGVSVMFGMAEEPRHHLWEVQDSRHRGEAGCRVKGLGCRVASGHPDHQDNSLRNAFGRYQKWKQRVELTSLEALRSSLRPIQGCIQTDASINPARAQSRNILSFWEVDAHLISIEL